MKIGIPKEIRPGENRVAISPDAIKKLTGMGVEVVVETGCGTGSCVTDQEYQEAGASVAPDAASVLGGADLVFKIQRPMTAEEGTDEIALMKEGAILVGHLATLSNPNASSSYNARNLTTFRHGPDAAHQPRAVHGRTLLAEQPGWLQGGRGCRD